MSFYKLYFKEENGSYIKPEIYQNMKQVLQRISKDSRGYLIIHRYDNRDEIVDCKQATVKVVDEVKTKTKANAKVFYLEEPKKTKKQKRAERKRQLQSEIEEYIDR